MTAVVALLCLLVGSAVIMASGSAAELPPQSCDVLIAGGSTAALSTALTAAVAGGPGLSVCLAEPTARRASPRRRRLGQLINIHTCIYIYI